jgi:hypothetical protein
VPRFGRYAEWLELESDRFDHTSELPAEANAGNRFYGRDVAEFVRSGLSAHGVDARVVEEDWGWLVLARPPGATVEIAVYHNLDDDPEKDDTWNLMVRRRERRLLFPAERPVDAETMRALDEMCRVGGISLRRVERSE